MKLILTHKLKIIQVILFLSLVEIVGIFLFHNYFHFALFGDDWQYLFNLKFFTMHHTLSFRDFISPYGGELLFMAGINKFFGLTAQAYFITSFIFRTLAAFTLGLLGYYLSRSVRVSIGSTFLFLLSFAGIETSNWVLTANTYLSFAVLAIGFIFLINYYKTSANTLKSRSLIISYVLICFAIILCPIRMHGLIFLIPIIEILLFATGVSKIQSIVVRLTVFLLTIWFMKVFGIFGLDKDLASHAIKYSTGNFLNPHFLLTPFAVFTNTIIPPSIFYSLYSVISNTYLPHIVFSKIFLFISMCAIVFYAYKRKSKHILLFGSIIVLWAIFLFLLRYVLTAAITLDGIKILLGSYISFILITISIYSYDSKHKYTSLILLILLVAPFCFIVVPYVYGYDLVNLQASRYLTIPAAFSSLLLAFISLKFIYPGIYKKNSNQKVQVTVAILVYFLFIIGNYASVSNYFQKYSETRLNSDVQLTSDNIYAIVKKYDNKNMLWYFESDNGQYYQDAIFFGGEFRYAVTQNHIDHAYLPAFFTNKDQLVIYIQKNKLSQNDINRIIGFTVKNKKVIDSTQSIRQFVESRVNGAT